MRWPVKERVNAFDWHIWFAWYPVQVDNEIVWLEKVARRFRHLYAEDEVAYQLFKGENLEEYN